MTLKDVTISGGETNSWNDGGGALLNKNRLTIVDSTLSGNTANSGGAIFGAEGSDTTIENSTLVDNFARYWDYGNGGAVYSQGTLTINNSLISSNRAWVGGGIRSRSELNISNSTITNNLVEGEYGGATAVFPFVETPPSRKPQSVGIRPKVARTMAVMVAEYSLAGMAL
ncbi:MAG: right-handed parallel beta-helix repeat-containing protein [Chloroflexota bacterium]